MPGVKIVLRSYNSGLPEARQATPFNLELWRQWEGQCVDSVFALDRCMGGSSRGAVFETQFQDRRAAIKIVPGTPEAIDALLASWERAASLSHPTLVEIRARRNRTRGHALRLRRNGTSRREPRRSPD